ncbi:MAG: membrane protein insertase YidC [Pseudomonadota bacterium]
MKPEHRTIIAVALSAAFFILWITVINPSKKPPQDATAPAAQTAPAANPQGAAAAPTVAGTQATNPPSAPVASGPADPQAKLPVKTWTIKNDLVEAELTSDGAVLASYRVLKYRQTTDAGSPAIDLAASSVGLPPALSLLLEGANFAFPVRAHFELVSADESKAVFEWRSPEVVVVKTISIPKDSYVADVSVEVKNRTSRALSARALLAWSGMTPPPKKGGFFSFLKQPSSDTKDPVYYINGSVKRETNPAKIGARSEQSGSVLWSGVESRYFLSAVIPRVQGEGLSVEYGSAELSAEPAGTRGVWAGAALPQFTAVPGEAAVQRFSVYAGPKEINQLKAVGVKLDEAIDYGWFTVIAVPILYLLKFFYGAIRNYGVAIILLTIFVKLLLHPVNIKSLKSMKEMQRLQPKLKELQQKHKGDKQRINQETMQLFRAHKVNPMGGCLPMLLQFPIYIALYKVLWNSIELYHAPFFGFYRDLSAPDPYLITPILLGIFMVAQQKLMPSASADPAQQKMMMFMPIMFAGFMLFLPVGLVVYILINTAMSVTQQWMYNKGIRYRDLIRGKWLPRSA